MSGLPASAVEAPPVERELAADMIRRALPLAPALVLVAALGWGVAGALSAAYGVGIVLANLALSAAMLAWAGRRSTSLLVGVAMFGYLVRMALVCVAILAVRDRPWVELLPLGLTVVVTHLGLLLWEAGRVSATLAFPGLKPGTRGS